MWEQMIDVEISKGKEGEDDCGETKCDYVKISFHGTPSMLADLFSRCMTAEKIKEILN